MINKMKIAGLVGGALLLCGTQAQAEITWSYGGSTSESTTLGNTVFKTSGPVGNTVSVTSSAWSNTNNGTPGTSSAALGSNTTSGSNGYRLEAAYLNVYGGGLGVKNQDVSSSSYYGDKSEGGSPEHATDNDQRYDSVLFSFSSAVDLNSVTLGWWSNDSDISVLRYDGDDPGSTSGIAGKTYSQLLTSGWNLVSQDNASTATTKILTGTAASSYWLIGAANPLLGAATDFAKDYVKILALAGEKYTPPCNTPGTPGCGGTGTSVPEPGTLLLMGAGLFGLSRVNRRPAFRFAA